MRKGVGFLKATQSPDGSWAPRSPAHRDQRGNIEFHAGLTALSVYALAASDTPSADASIQRALRWTKTPGAKGFKPDRAYATYSNALLILALVRLDPVRHRGRVQILADRLVRGQLPSGMWTYRLASLPGANGADGMRSGDNSNTQFAAIALWAAHSMCGFEAPESTWRRVLKLYEGSQQRDGSWGYTPSRVPASGTTTMTAAALAAIVYAHAALNEEPEELVRARKLRHVQKGLEWFRRMSNPGFYRNPYYLYGLERASSVLALPLDGWYVEPAEWLLGKQRAGGGWALAKGTRSGEQYVYDTALVLLFLNRATLPPRKGVVTETELTRKGTTTRDSGFPDLVDPSRGAGARLERAFTLYGYYAPARRAAVAPLFSARGAGVLTWLVDKLESKDETTREAATDLLSRLSEKKIFFEPGAAPEDRKAMLAVIREWFSEKGAALEWDPETKRFR